MKVSTRKYVERKYLLYTTKFVYIYIYIYIYIIYISYYIYKRVDWKVLRLIKVFSWNVIKWELFFNIVNLAVPKILSSVLKFFDPIDQKSYQMQIWHHIWTFQQTPVFIYQSLYFSQFVSLSLFLFLSLSLSLCLSPSLSLSLYIYISY